MYDSQPQSRTSPAHGSPDPEPPAHRRSPRLRWAAALYLVAFALAVTWPGALLINRVHPLILGLPFNMVWILLWVMGGGVVLYLVDRVEHP
ncbi:MAG: DUF3311 domain-containing protein [Gemmatimonadota bacterium]